MTEERLEAVLARLERERADADRAYNDALTALDRAVATRPGLPAAPPGFDDSRRAGMNGAWNLLPDGPPALDRSLKGRLRGFVWRLVGPALEQQTRLNSMIVDHLNRNAAGETAARDAVGALVDAVRHELEARQQFQATLLRYLQTVTLYVDTKDRAVGGQVKVVAAGLSAVADDGLKRSESLAARAARVTAELEDLGATASIAQQTSLSLKREVERLLTSSGASAPVPATGSSVDGGVAAPAGGAPPVAADLDAFKYLGFEDQFRGSREVIRARLSAYVPLFAGLGDVVDLGCGRGEFLDLLRDGGLTARGVDLNHEMVEASRARGFDVTEGDALGFLERQPDASIGGLFAAQVVEHLEPGYLMRLLETAFHKLRPGGLIVLETINVACWLAFFESYIRDLTHVRPIHPETLQYLLRVSGFRDVRIDFRPPEARADRLDEVASLPEGAPPGLSDVAGVVNANVGRLNARLFSHLDYAAIGRR